MAIVAGAVYACSELVPHDSNTDAELANLRTWYVPPPPKGHNLIIWRDDIAKEKGEAFLEAGEFSAHARQMAELVACVIAPGTKVVVTGAGVFTRTVTVVSGKDDGCEGSADVSGLTHTPPAAKSSLTPR